MDLSHSAATLAISAVAIAPSHHRRLRVGNVNIDARMPQPDRAPAVGRLRVADGVDQVRFNRALQVESGPMSFKEFDTVVMKAGMPSHVAKEQRCWSQGETRSGFLARAALDAMRKPV
jgi:hypothetical protein